MSGVVSTMAPGSSYGSLSALVADSTKVRTRLDTLTQQASTGQIASSYAGLGSGARVSLDLNPVVAHQQVWQNGIDQASGNLQVTQTAMTQIQSIASNLYAQLNDLNGLNSSTVDNVAAGARDSLRQLADLLDTKDGDTYVFAGQDGSNPPVPDLDNITSSGFYSQIATSVGQLAANGLTATASATLATASSNAAGTSPFSGFLSQPVSTLLAQRSIVPTGDGQAEPVGLLASGNAAVTSTGSSTTGSYMRDVMRALATVGSLSSSQLTDGSDFAGLVADTRTSLGGAISAMSQDTGVLGDTQTRLSGIKTQLSDAQTALKTQISGAEDVDMASTLSNLTLVQTQMQASYQLISGMSGLSLVKFLSA